MQRALEKSETKLCLGFAASERLTAPRIGSALHSADAPVAVPLSDVNNATCCILYTSKGDGRPTQFARLVSRLSRVRDGKVRRARDRISWMDVLN